MHPWDVSDDRRAPVLEAWRDDARWRAVAGALTQRARRGYDRHPACIRLARMTASGPGTGTADGRCPLGHRHDPRPALPPGQVMVSALAPLGLPVAPDVVPGQRADEPRSIPASARVRAGLGRRGLRSGGDGQMGALETRAYIRAGGDDHLGPVAEVPLPPAVWAGDPSRSRR